MACLHANLALHHLRGQSVAKSPQEAVFGLRVTILARAWYSLYANGWQSCHEAKSPSGAGGRIARRGGRLSLCCITAPDCVGYAGRDNALHADPVRWPTAGSPYLRGQLAPSLLVSRRQSALPLVPGVVCFAQQLVVVHMGMGMTQHGHARVPASASLGAMEGVPDSPTLDCSASSL
jgi:hypothetical protein